MSCPCREARLNCIINYRRQVSQRHRNPMIPHEILKKIQQVKMHTNHLVSKLVKGGSCQTVSQHAGVPSPMPKSNNFDLLPGFVYDKEDGIRPTFNFNFLGEAAGKGKAGWLRDQRFDMFVNDPVESQTKSGFTLLIPICRVTPFAFRRRLDKQLKHYFFAPRRRCISAKTSSAGMPLSGCFSASSARRSSSAICSGDNSSPAQPSSLPNSDQICSTTARFSSVFKPRICSMISVALTVSNYHSLWRYQAANPGRNHPSHTLRPSQLASS
jgi:hypothetical protein